MAEYFFCTRDFYRINDKKLASGVPLGPFLRRRSLLLRVPGDAGMAGVYLQGKSVAKKLPNNSSIEFLKFHRFCVELSVVFLI